MRTIAAILANPRYTGRQVWNRQTTHHAHDDVAPPLVHGWTDPQQWVISTKPTHPPLISEADFVAVQAIRATRPTADGSSRTYRLAGLVRCRVCHRRMDSHWIHHRPGYRCRHGHTSTQQRSAAQPKNLYLREDHLLTQLTTHFSNLNPDNTKPARGSEADTTEVIQYLRTHNLVIIVNEQGQIVDTTPA